jgi:protein phosphatase
MRRQPLAGCSIAPQLRHARGSVVARRGLSDMARGLIETVGLTDVGSVRQYNEDAILVDPDFGIVAVADGMGGHRAGEVASRMATTIVDAQLRAHVGVAHSVASLHSPTVAVRESIVQANRAIYEAAQADASRRGMGTTIAVAFFQANQAVLGHVGDSRIYRLRDGRLQLLTRDDSLLRDQVELGVIDTADAAYSHNRSLVTRALGVGSHAEPHVHATDTAPGDLFLLCSDGINEMVEDADIELILNSLRANLALAARHLLQAAQDNGGRDNLSLVLARIRARRGDGAGLFARLFRRFH